VGFFGVKSFSDLQAKVNDVNAWHQDVGGKQQDVQRIHAQLRGAETNLRIVKESTIEIRAIRETAGLGQRVETADDLRWVALNYEQAKRRVLQRYIGTPGTGAAYEAYEPQVVLEAVDTFLDLARGARPGGELRLTSEDRREDPSAAVLGALTFVLRNLPEAREPGRSGWLEDIKLREMFPLVARAAPDRDRKAAIKELKSIVTEKPGRDRTSDNAALILAGFGEKDDATVAILMRMSEDKQRPWRAAGGAVALARLGVGRGWQDVTQQLEGERDRGAYAAAVVLAQQGRDGLEELALKVGQPRDEAGRLAQNVKRVIGGRTPRNCFEQRYARWLVACLDGDCREGKAGEVIGGECTLGR
jgi:hypothetical protein